MCIYWIFNNARYGFEEYTKNMNLKEVLKKFKSEPCLLYIVNKLGISIFIIHVDEMLPIGDKQVLLDTL